MHGGMREKRRRGPCLSPAGRLRSILKLTRSTDTLVSPTLHTLQSALPKPSQPNPVAMMPLRRPVLRRPDVVHADLDTRIRFMIVIAYKPLNPRLPWSTDGEVTPALVNSKFG